MTSGAQHSVIPTVALDDQKVTPGVYRFLGVLSAYAARGGYVTASMTELAARLAISRQAVSKGLDILVALGYAETEPIGAGRGVRIRLLPDPVIPPERLRAQPLVTGSELETGNYESESKAYAQPLVTGSELPSQPLVTGHPSASQPTVTGTATPARGRVARGYELSTREFDTAESPNGSATSGAAAVTQPNRSSLPGTAAAPEKQAFTKLPIEQRTAGERIVSTLYSVAGLDWQEVTAGMQRREILIGQQLAAKGANPAEAAAFVAWCQADAHRPQVSSMRTYENQRANFRAQTSSRSITTSGELGTGTVIE